MTKRLFIAIPLPDVLAGELAARAEALVAGCRGVRLTPKGDLHLTVHFLGDVEEDALPRLREAAAAACAAIAPFTLEIGALEFAPPGGPPRMLWARFGDNGVYGRLSAALTAACRPLTREERRHDPVPHATLARFKDPACVRGVSPDGITMKAEPFMAEACVLFESRLAPEGPTCVRLDEFRLSAVML